jgi:hypothetical protein
LDEIIISPSSRYGPWEDNSLDSTSIKPERPYGIDERFLVATKECVMEREFKGTYLLL